MRGGQRRGVWPFSTNPRLLSAQTGNCSSVPFSQRLIRKHKEGFSPRSKSKGQCLIGVCVCVCVCVCVYLCGGVLLVAVCLAGGEGGCVCVWWCGCGCGGVCVVVCVYGW